MAAIPLLDGTIGDRLRANAERFADRPALLWDVDGELRVLTYRDLLPVVEATVARLEAIAGQGDRIAVWAANSPEWVVLEFACALAGVVLTPFNTAWMDEEVRHALRLTEPAAVWAGPDNRGIDLHARAKLLTSCDVLDIATVLTDPAALPPDRPPCARTVRPEDPFLIQFTSGTTGRAKGATLSHRAALNSGFLRAALCQADDTDSWLNPVPLHHIGGSCAVILGALSVGASYLAMPRFDAASMVELLRRSGATRVGGVPTMLYALLDAPGADAAFATVRMVGLGGTSIPPSLVERLQRDYGVEVANTYAQSECPLITSTGAGDPPEGVAGTVGRPVPHTELRIITGAGEELPRGEIGELCVRSPLTMTGYWNMPEATAQAFDPDHFLRTGDLGSIDADGFVRIHGRAREVIIRGGENVYPIEVEDVLLRHPAVEAAAVLAVPSATWGEEVGAVVKLASAATGADLQDHAGRSLAHFKVPRHWRFVDAFPLTASGKIRKMELAALFEGD